MVFATHVFKQRLEICNWLENICTYPNRFNMRYVKNNLITILIILGFSCIMVLNIKVNNNIYYQNI